MTHRQLRDLDPHARDMVGRSLAWLDALWDAATGLLHAPSPAIYEDAYRGTPHLVRETAQYALGLLLRGGPGDLERACAAIERVLDYQFDAPAEPFHGTWYRAPEEPAPPPNPRVWQDYDPNWREFIGTALAVALIEYEPQLPAALVERIDVALRRAIEGTLARDLPASYTNIALMCAFLLQYGGARFNQPGWLAQAEHLADQIYALFAPGQTFAEYNSPTYYAVDLYALALWRRYAESARLRDLGALMEAGLWRDVGLFYHAELRNMCGPYDRSYGMDMRQYAAGLGMWIWLAAGRERAPFPDTDAPFEHSWDFGAAATYALPGAVVPDEALAHLRAFESERQVEREIAVEPRRVASAWLGQSYMIGAEDSGGSHAPGWQYHPATLHWRCPDGRIGWARLRHITPADAQAERGHLSISVAATAPGDLTLAFEIHAPGAQPADLAADRWRLPGLSARVSAPGAELTADARAGDLVELRYVWRDRAIGDVVRIELVLESD
jgi:hypothetical protein